MIRNVFKGMLLTQILSAMTVTLCLLVDSMMIGRFLGVNSMTAYGLSSPVLLVFAALGAMLSAGVQVVSGKTMGRGDIEETNSCFSVSIIASAAIVVIGLVVVFLMPDQLCMLLGAGSPSADNEIFFLTKDYLIGFIVGAPAFIFAQIMIPYAQMAGQQNRLIVAVVFMIISDVVFDLMNVYLFHGGMLGMGLASSFSYYIAVAIGLTYFISRKSIYKFSFRFFKLSTGREIVKHGIPTVINQISLVLLVYVFNRILLEVGGNLAVAAYSVVSTVSNICYSFGSGVAAVSLTLSAVFMGDEDRSSLHALMRIMTWYAVVLDLVLTVVVIVIAPVLVGIFLEDAAAKDMALAGVRLFSLSLISCSLNTSLKNFYQGTGRQWLTQFISFTQNFVFCAIYAFVLSRFIAETGVWLAFVLGETTTLIIICVIVFVHNKRVAFSAEAFAMLSDEIGVNDHELFERVINTKEEVVKVSEELYDFCKEHGESKKTATYLSLCLEEMANNIIEYGFTSDKRKHTIDVRFMNKRKKRFLRIRDDCRSFDPVTYTQAKKDRSEDKDITSHIGIRMVMNMVKDANYINSLGLNNLTLEL